jgi:hypothetical protein
MPSTLFPDGLGNEVQDRLIGERVLVLLKRN